MKTHHTKALAVWMAWLIVLIPIYSASVWAQLSDSVAYGTNNVEGFLRSDEDVLTVRTTAFVTGDTDVTPGQVRLYGSDYTTGFGFLSCSANVCTFTHNLTDWKLSHPTHVLSLNLYSDSGTRVDSKAVSVTFDKTAPSVTSFTATPSLVGANGTINVAFSVSDPTPCSGISKVEYSMDSANFSSTTSNTSSSNASSGSTTQTFTPESTACTYSKSDITIDASTLAEGKHTLYLQAYDRLSWKSSVTTATFEIDKTGPSFGTPSLKDSDGETIQWVTAAGISAVFSIEIFGTDLNKDTIVADLSQLNSESGYSSKKPTKCTELTNSSKCEWSITVKIANSITPQVSVTAADTVGNSKTQTFTLSALSYDGTGPKFASIQSSKVYSSTNYIKANGNTIIASVYDAGAGIEASDVYLDLSGLGMGSSVAASNCSGTTTYTCYWYNVWTNKQHNSKVKVKSGSNTEDKLGNKLNSTLEAEMLVDTEPPTLNSMNVTTIGGEEAVLSNYTKKGDSFSITSSLEEGTTLTAYGDFSSAIEDATRVAGSCEESETDTWTCLWDTSAIDISGYYEDYLYFNFTDFVGNSLTHQEKIVVYGLDDDTDPNYWDSTVTCSPELVDRQVTTLLNVKVYCHVDLIPLASTDQETLSIDLGECIGSQVDSSDSSNSSSSTDSMDYVNDVTIWNNEAGSTDPYLNVELKTSEMKINSLEIMCPLSIMTRSSGTLTQYPETENTTITIEFYNLPLGEVSEDLQDKIDDAIDDATNTLMEIIGFLEMIIYYADLICTAINAWNNIVGMWNGITQLLGNAEKAAAEVPPAYAALYNARQTLCYGTEEARSGANQLYSGTNKFCAFMNCKLGPAPEDEEKKGWGNWVNTLGGGGGAAKWINDNYPGVKFIKDWTGKSPSEYMNVRDSIVLSLVTFCVPGIVYNLNKYRQIQCMYAYCLKEYVKAGLPISVCEDQKHYLTCKYLVGEIFNLIPFVALFDYYIGMVKDALSDPFSIVGTALGLICSNFCSAPIVDVYEWCAWVKIISMLGETVNDVINIIEGWGLDRDYCGMLEEDGDDSNGDGGFLGGLFG